MIRRPSWKYSVHAASQMLASFELMDWLALAVGLTSRLDDPTKTQMWYGDVGLVSELQAALG
jgi:hypothetical protein